MKELYVLDGYSLIYRSYYAFIKKPLYNAAGHNIGAAHGFYQSLFSFFKTVRPQAFVVALDSIEPTFRYSLYPQYKATRQKTPEDLHSQTAIIEELLQALNIKTLRCNGFEADDIIATLCKQRSNEGKTTYILSGDKDLMQLVNDTCLMLKPDKGQFVRIDAQAVQEEKGVKPSQINDYLALVGDASDNIPGAAGIGPKGAAKILAQYGDVDSLYAQLESVEPASLQEKLRQSKDNVYLSRQLAALRYDAPCGQLSMEEQSCQTLNYAAAAAVFKREGLEKLAAECQKQAENGTNLTENGTNSHQNEPKNSLFSLEQEPLPSVKASSEEPFLESYETLKERLDYRLIASEKELEAWAKSMQSRQLFAFDCETDGLDSNSAQPVGFSFSAQAGEAVYICLKGPQGQMIGEEAARKALKPILEHPKARIIGQNIKFDLKILRRWGVSLKPYFDTMIAAWLLDSESAVNMDFLAKRYLNYKTIGFNDIVPKGQLFQHVSLEQACPYAAEDADITFKLYLKLQPLIKEKELELVMYGLEMPLIEILAAMELQGIQLNAEKLKIFSAQLETQIAAIEKEAYASAGREFNIQSPKQLSVILFEELKLPAAKKTATGYSTDVAVLEELARYHTLPELVLQSRSLSKLKSTYADALPKQADAKGRVHTDYLQTGTATGRLSSRNPNLQNIPVREENGRRIREAFESGAGWNLISADYNQIELAVLAHLAEDQIMLEVFAEGRDLHKETAAYIYGAPAAEITAAQRRTAKTINFGVIYGMSAFRLSNELKIPRAQAAAYIEAYFNRYAKVKEFMEKTLDQAEKEGGVRTLLGRFRPIPALASRNKTERAAAERAAINTAVQGSAADIMKLAMLGASRALKEQGMQSRLLLQVHDEIILEAPEAETEAASALLQRAMQQAGMEAPRPIVLKTNIETGKNWGEFH